jgi:hypothetical protein
MNYKMHYDKLIDRARNRHSLECYTETHHINPRCIGGNNLLTNLVELTPEEHLIAHLLLVKIYNNSKLLHAAMRMYNKKSANTKNKGYGFLRRAFANYMRNKMIGAGNNMYGKHHSDDAKKKIGNGNRGRIPSSITRSKMSESHKGKISPLKGRKRDLKIIEKIKIATTGENNPMYGRTHSDDTKKKIGIKSVGRKPRLGAILSKETKELCRIAAKNRIPITCIYCNKTVSPSNYSRWHNNCKMKESMI